MDLSTIESTTRLAEQFGPFLFAILFILVVTRTAHGYYVQCMTRTQPPPSEQEQRTYRQYFLLSVWAGIAAMGLSIGWWLYAQTRGNNVYQIAIVDLKADEKVLSGYYVRDTPRPTMGEVAAMHDTFFLIVQEHPFRPGERLAFQYFKMPANPSPGAAGVSSRQLEVLYAGGNKLTFRVVGDEANPRLDLVARDDRAPTTVFTADDVKAARELYASAAEAR